MKLKSLFSLALAASLVVVGYANNDQSISNMGADSHTRTDSNLDYDAAVNLINSLLPYSANINVNNLIDRQTNRDNLSDLVDMLIAELEYSAAKRAEFSKSLYEYSNSEILSTSDVIDNIGDIDAKPSHSEVCKAIDDLMANGGTEEIASLKDATLDYLINVIEYLKKRKEHLR